MKEQAKLLPEAWRSVIVAKPGGANLKVLRMDGSVLPDETHDFAEALILLEGELNLQVANKTISIGPGEAVIVYPGQSHSVWAKQSRYAHHNRCVILLADVEKHSGLLPTVNMLSVIVALVRRTIEERKAKNEHTTNDIRKR